MRGKIFRQQGSKLSGKHYRKQLNTITQSGSGFAHPMSGTIDLCVLLPLEKLIVGHAPRLCNLPSKS
jgi:hypothetical protein